VVNVLDRIKAGEADWEWTKIAVSVPNSREKIVFQCMKDAMKLDGIRFMVSAREQQEIADLIGGVFHTSKTMDERHKAADVKIGACTQVPPGSGKIAANSTPEAMHPFIEESIRVAYSKTNVRGPGLISTVGKPWVITNNMADPKARYGNKTAFNYGWHDKSAAYTSPCGLKIWQPVVSARAALVHNDEHKDPSQTCEMLSREAFIINSQNVQVEVDVETLLKDPVYSTALSYEGPLRVTRQQSVQFTRGHTVLPPVVIRT
jgi:hypothetical protein